MSGIFSILVGGITGWLTGTLMGKEGYGKRLLGDYTRSLMLIRLFQQNPIGCVFIHDRKF